MNLKSAAVLLALGSTPLLANAGAHYASGKVTSLLAHGSNPAIRITDNISPSNCTTDVAGWMYFAGTVEEKANVYATALAMSLSGHTITVYTNDDGQPCQIHNIQITNGLN